jgi:GTP-binding protein
VADVALVGFPNVGKSTLISRISAATPKIADYPFTTLEPHLGVVRGDHGADFTVADIPGLVEGAAEGKGLGHQFLRHITRARVLLIMVELDPVTGIDPARQQRVLVDELRRYQPGLIERPCLVVGTKVDVLTGGTDETGVDGAGTDMNISAVTGQGINQLVGKLGVLVASARADEPVGDGTVVIHRPAAEGFTVVRVGEGEFRVEGRVAERAVALNDVTTDEAADYVQGRLRRIGVDRALARAGARDGDVVHIGDLAFVWTRDQPEFTGNGGGRRRRS